MQLTEDQHMAYDTQCDVYGGAMCMYYICACSHPFAQQRAESAARSAYSGARPPLDDVKSLYPESLVACIVAGWSHDAKQRPSASKLVLWLGKIKRAMGGEWGLQSILNKTSTLFRPAAMLLGGRTATAEAPPNKVMPPQAERRPSIFSRLQKNKEVCTVQARSQSMVVSVPPSPAHSATSPERQDPASRMSPMQTKLNHRMSLPSPPSPLLCSQDHGHKPSSPAMAPSSPAMRAFNRRHHKDGRMSPISSPKNMSRDFMLSPKASPKLTGRDLVLSPMASPKYLVADRFQNDHPALGLERLPSLQAREENDATSYDFCGKSRVQKLAAASFDRASSGHAQASIQANHWKNRSWDQ
jgi:hypothetical protein